jgi:hypothetical protein
MYGPAVASKEVFIDLVVLVLHQCIRPLIGACCAPGRHGYQRACVLISGQASNGPFGSPGLAGAGKTDPPFRFHPLADLGRESRAMSSIPPHWCSSFICAVAVPSSRPAGCAGHRAQGPSRLAVGVAFVPAPASAGHPLRLMVGVRRRLIVLWEVQSDARASADLRIDADGSPRLDRESVDLGETEA